MRRNGLAILALCTVPFLAAASDRPPTPNLAYAIVDTGQTRCYDQHGRSACPGQGQAFYGQDSQIVGHQPHYRDNQDGTISDLVTGLMWQKGFSRTSFAAAAAQAAASRTGGYTDWRVPSTKELYSLINFSGATGSAGPSQTGAPADAEPYLDRSVFDFEYPRQGRFIDAQYVASTTYGGLVMAREKAFFGVNFADGRIKGYPQSGGPGQRLWYGRWVRGNTAYGHNDFIDNGDQTITDRATGLTWTKADSGEFAPRLGDTAMRDGRLDWAEALAFCQDLDLAGRDDWRLPNAKELQSIVDYTRSPAATGTAALASIFSITAITESDGSRNWPYFWSSTSHLDGRRPGSFAVYVAFGKAMGNLGAGGFGGGFGGGGQPGMGPPPGMSGQFGPSQAGPARLVDVHGAGAQRSSPKSGDESRLPIGAGPQGDVLRIYNFARCVR